MSDLSKLADPRNQEALLIAELAAWLHDIGKLSSEFINSKSEISENNKWDHELVLRRSTRRIESDLGKSLSEANKDDFRSLVQTLLNAEITDHTSQRTFPNPRDDQFINKLTNYILHLNKKNITSVSDADIKRVKDYFGTYFLEQQISERFLSDSFYEFAELNKFSILGQEANIADLIEQHGSPVQPKTELVKIFKPPGCDAIDSAMDKGSVDECNRENKQGSDTFIATAFGFESKSKMITNIDQLRQNLANSNSLLEGTHNQRKKAIKNAFFSALGETRRPANDVTLWDHSYSVGALYRTLLAKIILTEDTIPTLSSFLREDGSGWTSESWRLLKIRMDGLGYLLNISGIPDLLARKMLLKDALNRIQAFLEETCPLGVEVYRDENGSLFVVPNIQDLLNDTINGKLLSEYLLEDFQQGTLKEDASLSIDGEIIPALRPLSEPWDGINNIPPVGRSISEEVLICSDSKSVNRAWMPIREDIGKNLREYAEQTCIVCGLRPQGSSKKAKERDVCDVCEQRRTDRSKEWATEKLNTTIWIDEVADINGRLALIVGNFGLSKWLSGDLVRTMTVCDPSGNVIVKNPSFARLRRIWETTQKFWLDVCPTDKAENIQESLVNETVGMVSARLEIRGTTRQRNGTYTPGPYHAYDLVLPKGIKLSVSWDPETDRSTEPKGRFISIDNLIYLVSLAGDKAPPRDKDEREEDYSMRLHRWAVEGLKELIQGTITIEEATGYGGKAKEWGEIEVDYINIIPNSQYTPAIPILAEPRTFMALVPADKALKTVEEIKAKYEREMGKVRNRLPLHLGIVYAHRRTPLRAILDAGRKMLDRKLIGDVGAWAVAGDVTEKSGMLPDKAAYLSEGSNQFTKWYPVGLKHQEMNRELVWHIPSVMGDGTTPDNWYPYVFWSQDKDGKTEPANATIPRSRYFKSRNPWKEASSESGWLVHAGELKEGDLIYFTAATLDFQWLDSAGRRFEIAYDEHGKRFNIPRRPYLLDEIESLNEIWQTLSNHLTKNQIYILRDLIEAKKEDWKVKTAHPVREDVFWRFCRNALANAQWTKGKKDRRENRLPWESEEKDRKDWLDQWADYGVRGWITDAIEIYLQIMKEEV
ncbi:MAG: hypothetical protein QM438_11085 [Euryarchaeota archaeon]|nr:hypothetical protein [Euryarchaeota archaeon]